MAGKTQFVELDDTFRALSILDTQWLVGFCPGCLDTLLFVFSFSSDNTIIILQDYSSHHAFWIIIRLVGQP